MNPGVRPLSLSATLPGILLCDVACQHQELKPSIVNACGVLQVPLDTASGNSPNPVETSALRPPGRTSKHPAPTWPRAETHHAQTRSHCRFRNLSPRSKRTSAVHCAGAAPSHTLAMREASAAAAGSESESDVAKVC